MRPALYLYTLKGTDDGSFWTQILGGDAQQIPSHLIALRDCPAGIHRASINVLFTENFQYLGLFTSDPREYRMSLYWNGSLFWRGFIVADLYSEKFAAPPYDVTIKGVDGFSAAGEKTLRLAAYGCLFLMEKMADCVIGID